MNINIDSSIFIGFLLINLIAGIYYSKGINNIREFAIGNRNFSTATIVATLVATWISGGSFSLYMSETYSQGLSFILAILADAGSFIIIGCIFAPRMAEFLGQLSVAEAMGSLYGRHVRIITALAGFIGTIGALAIQFKVSSTVLSYLFGISPSYAVLISSFVVIIYSAFGGIKSVTFTDLIQFFMFGTIIPIVIFVIWTDMENPTLLLSNTLTENPLFDYHQLLDYKNPTFWTTLTIFLYFLIPGLSPATFQRITMAKNVAQVKRSFVAAAVVLLLVELLIAWIAILLLSKDPNLDSSNLISYIIDNYAYTGLKGLVVTGIMAMIMSTADSYINSAAVLFSHDVCRPLNIISKQSELVLSRLFSIFLGAIALIFTFSGASLLDLFLLGYSFYMIIVTVPFIMAILGFRSTTKSVLIGMISGMAMVLIWMQFGKAEVDSVIPGMITNLVFFVGSHYLLKQPGGWIGIKDYGPLEQIRKERKIKRNSLIEACKNFNLSIFLSNNCPRNEAVYVYFGLFCIISTFSTIYTLPQEIQSQHSQLITFVYASMLFMSTTLVSYPLWLTGWKDKNVIATFWNLAIFYILICVGFLFVVVSNFAHMQLIAFMLNLIIVAFLVRWQLALLMIATGLITTIQFFKSYLGIEHLPENFIATEFEAVYLLLLVSSILIIFLKPKQEYQELTEEKNEHLSGRIGSQEKQLREAHALRSEFIRNVQHEYHAPMTGITRFAEILSEKYDKLTDEQRKMSIDQILTSSGRLDAFDSNLSSLSALSKAGYKLELEKINLSNLLDARIATCRKLYEDNSEAREFDLDIEEGVIINGDSEYLTQVLDNLIINAITYCKAGKITVDLRQSDKQIHFSITDEGIGIPPDELEMIFDEFTVSSKTRTPAGNRGVGLALCKRVVEVHGGTIKAESDGVKGATFLIDLNKN